MALGSGGSASPTPLHLLAGVFVHSFCGFFLFPTALVLLVLLLEVEGCSPQPLPPHEIIGTVMRVWSQVQGWAVRPLVQQEAVPVPAVAAELPLTLCSPSTSRCKVRGWGVGDSCRDWGQSWSPSVLCRPGERAAEMDSWSSARGTEKGCRSRGVAGWSPVPRQSSPAGCGSTRPRGDAPAHTPRGR